MPTLEKKIFLASKTLLIAAGSLLTAYSWVSTFYQLPSLIEDWRLALILGNLLLVGGLCWTIADLYRRYVWWAEPEIRMSAKRDADAVAGRFADCAYLIIYNNEESEIAECYATLVDATNLYGETLDAVNIVEKGYLAWKEGQDCSITIPPKDERTVRVADNLNGFQFCLCKPSRASRDLLGIYSPITVRIDGKLNGKNIKPQYFHGYLYVSNRMGESGEMMTTVRDGAGKVRRTVIPSQPKIFTTLIFEAGDWQRDQRIPLSQANKDLSTQGKK
jgi:hypothetical protein